MTHDEDYLAVRSERYGTGRDPLTAARLAADLSRARLELKIANISAHHLGKAVGELTTALDRIEAMHQPAYDEAGDPDRPPWCAECGHPYPCRTAERASKLEK